jgi:hypothetical protein
MASEERIQAETVGAMELTAAERFEGTTRSSSTACTRRATRALRVGLARNPATIRIWALYCAPTNT